MRSWLVFGAARRGMLHRRTDRGWSRHVVLGPVLGLLFVALVLQAGGGCAKGPRPVVPKGMVGKEQKVRAALAACGRCSRKPDLERRLERIHYRMAEQVDDIGSWSWFLSFHPKGIFAGKARTRLARLRYEHARRQRSRWLWEWFLVRHADSPLAVKAEQALANLLFEELRRRPDAAKIRAFIRRFPNNSHVPELLALLEQQSFAALGADSSLADLEAFVSQFPASPRAATVRAWIAARWRRRIERFGTAKDLAVYLRRFGAAGAKDLERRLLLRELRSALADLDVGRITRLVPSLGGKDLVRAKKILEWVKKNPKKAAEIRRLSRAARPFRPGGRPAALLVATTSPDPIAATAAIHALSFLLRAEAPRTLLLVASTATDPLAAAAWTALQRWLELAGADGRDLLRLLASDMASQGGASMARAMATAAAEPGRCLFGKMAEKQGLALLGACLASRCCRSERFVQRFRKAVERTQKWIMAQAKGKTGGSGKGREAARAAVRLRVLQTFVVHVAKKAGLSGRLSTLAGKIRARRQSLEIEAARAGRSQLLEIPFAVLTRAAGHENGRRKAFMRLCSSREALAEAVCNVLCEDDRWRQPVVCARKTTTGSAKPARGR